MSLIDKSKRERIRELNDALRTNMNPALGRVMLTGCVNDLPSEQRAAAIGKVATFAAFDQDNDHNGEHDFGSFEIAGQRFFFNIDCYDLSLEFSSDDPADPAKTGRVLTIMLAEQY
jgi:hypothetical protein